MEEGDVCNSATALKRAYIQRGNMNLPAEIQKTKTLTLTFRKKPCPHLFIYIEPAASSTGAWYGMV